MAKRKGYQTIHAATQHPSERSGGDYGLESKPSFTAFEQGNANEDAETDDALQVV